MSGRKILVAAAWPYVNGSLHLGHLAALLPGDVLARYHRAQGDDVLFVSGSDCHGTPILVTAERDGKTPEEVARHFHEEAVEMLTRRIGLSYSLYSKTMGEFHRQAAQLIFSEIFGKGYLVEKEEEQAYCEQCRRFLPDRYVLGSCPYCQAVRARGDQCDACGKLLNPKELKDPFCRVCESKPTWRATRHLYFDLPRILPQLKAWLSEDKQWRPNALNHTRSQLAQGLQQRAVTRDLSWGVPVPIPNFEEKCMYVWFEAVMGYLTCSQQWAEQQGRPDAWKEWWFNPDALHYYVHGKDNIPFHTIIWPAMLMVLGLHLPDRIVSSEYLTLGSQKFSKGEGVGVVLPEITKHFHPDAIRFFLILSGPETSDSTFQWQEFQNRVNGDLIDNVANLWNRVCAMAYRYYGAVPEYRVQAQESIELRKAGQEAFRSVGGEIERLRFRTAIRIVLELSSKVNQYVEQRVPWREVRERPEHVKETIGVALELVEAIRRLLGPFLPKVTEEFGSYLGVESVNWEYIPLPPGTVLSSPRPLLEKVQQEEWEDKGGS